MMLRTIKFYLTLLAVLVGASSCLDKYPESAILEKNAMRSFDDAEQHLTGIYSDLKSSALFSGLLTVLPDIQADLVYAVEGNSNTYGDHWHWDIRNTNAEIEAVYAQLYATIRDCNFFLDRIDEVIAKETNDDNLDLLGHYTGEVYCIRAICYSELLKCFCKAYDPETAKSELGVVLRTSYFKKEPIRRASLHDSYQFVIDDLIRAEERMSEDNDTYSNDYVSAAAAEALHARMALYMHNWDDAIKYSGMLIDRDKNNVFALADARNQNGSTGFSFFGYMWAYDLAYEIIWQTNFTVTSYGGALGQVFLNFNKDYTYYYPDYVPAKWVLDAYDDNDLRYSTYFSESIQTGFSNGLNWPLLVKYLGNQNFIKQYIFHVSMPKPFRLAEQYLIRAEAYCRKNNFSEAQNNLWALRKTRYASGGLLNLTKDNWLRNISNERVRELYMEGFRLNDLKRWGEEYAKINNGYSFERKPQTGCQTEGSSLKVKPTDPLFVWPIPQHELEAPGSEIEPNESNK